MWKFATLASFAGILVTDAVATKGSLTSASLAMGLALLMAVSAIAATRQWVDEFVNA